MISSEHLVEAVAGRWERIAAALGTEREAFEIRLTTLLRRLDAASGDERSGAIREILELFRQHDAAHRVLLDAFERFAKGGRLAAMPAGARKMERYTAVPVAYGTDRARVVTGDGRIDYGGGRGELELGFAEVGIPDDHRMGALEKPRLWKLEFREDPGRHVVVLEVEPLAAGDFDARTRQRVQRAAHEILLFVHGYNVGFTDAVRRAAQVAYDLHFEGLPALYSWPSEGSVPRYTVDETNVAWARPRFRRFLEALGERSGADVIHVIAHSMGARLVAETIADVALRPAAGARIRQIVFAAPDVDSGTFKDLAAAFPAKAERFTLYASSRDKAIKASHLVHKYPRAGDSGPGLVVLAGIDTVDATAVDTSLMGHSYYGDNRSVLSDLFDLIRRGSPPEDRFGLVSKEKYGARYWSFRA